jgi:small subunit ribosomal protein S20
MLQGGIKPLANHKSALKRARQSEAQRIVNQVHKSRAKTAVKDLRALLDEKNLEQAKKALIETVSILQKTASKKVIHKKKASRKISRLARAVNKAAASHQKPV